MHSHSKYYRKYINEKCLCHFGIFFIDHTFVSFPLPDNLSEQLKNNILNKRECALSKVKHYIDANLHLRKRNILNSLKDHFEELPSIGNILTELGITEEQYYNALTISIDTEFQIHIKPEPNSCVVDNYFAENLQVWKATTDIQPIFNYYKAATYMRAYFPKAKDEMSEAMKQVAKETLLGNKSDYEKMKIIARAYTTRRKNSVREAVYLLMPVFWSCKIFPRVFFLNSNLPEKRYKIFKKNADIVELLYDSTNLFQRNMLDRYLDRPPQDYKNGKFNIIDKLCFAELLPLHYKEPKFVDRSSNDCQSVDLEDALMESNHTETNFRKTTPLMTSKEKLKLW